MPYKRRGIAHPAKVVALSGAETQKPLGMLGQPMSSEQERSMRELTIGKGQFEIQPYRNEIAIPEPKLKSV